MAESAQIDKVSPKHEAILTFLIANPEMSRNEIARHFGVSPSWLSVVINSDVFQARLRERQDEFFSSALEPIRSKLTRLAEQSLDRLNEVVPFERDVDTLRGAAKLALEGLGFGQPKAPQLPGGNTTFNFIGVDPELLAAARNRIISRRPIDAIEGRLVNASSETHSAPTEGF